MNLARFQALENLRRHYNESDYRFLHDNLVRYFKEQNIVVLVERILHMFSEYLIGQVERVVEKRHLAIFHGYVNVFRNPNFLETEPNINFVKCRCLAKSIYQLPCGDFLCDKCYMYSCLASTRCKFCDRKFQTIEVNEML
ncbi:hypothetical protein RF11_14679 [Thelohanellus kitauei]|uniref:Uncharacterized protein n=1 Tax=Thelohanellus kitauei TaxID=669202 RepID=A0A0C2JNX4_THEKT|nr:hypothetical protein RF11_14679 [Thelohanellus kitauei]